MESARITKWLNTLVYVLLLLKAEGNFVPITRLENAVSKGAVCLDGSPPAYHYDQGFGEGVNNWIVHIEGGGWCNNVPSCLYRKNSSLGSSYQMVEQVYFPGVLSNEQQFIQTTKLHFRGARIFVAVIEDLLAKGMKNAENAILSGCSAGGLTTILHCDRFKELLPAGAKVKCVSDAGYFVNVKDISGAQHIGEFFSQVVATHGSAKNLPPTCTSRLSPELCIFPQNVAPQISTPIFIVNAAYDQWQIKEILVPDVADPQGLWSSCKNDIKNCSADQLSIIQGFREEFVSAVSVIGNSPSNGMFTDSCYVHCQKETPELWFSNDSPLLANTTIGKAVGNWFYERSPFHQIDCTYPCNPTCQNRGY